MATYKTRVRPLILCNKGQVIEGVCPCDALDRLGSFLTDQQAEINYLIDFSRESLEGYGRCQVKVAISGSIWLRCQRCYEKMSFNLKHESVLWPVTEDRILYMPKDREPLLMDSECSVLLKDIIEEEALLAIPAVPVHPEDVCTVVGMNDVN